MTGPQTIDRAAVHAAAPAGLNAAQLGAWRRVVAARAVLAELEPLDADYLAGEAYFERLREDR